MEDAERHYNMTIVSHQTEAELHLHPAYDEVIKADDKLVVFAALETLGQIGGITNTKHQHARRNIFKRLGGRKH